MHALVVGCASHPFLLCFQFSIMIDTLSVISNGGVVLWQHTTHETGRRGAVNRLIQDVLLEGRAGERSFTTGDCRMRWALENEAMFFVVGVYPKYHTPHYLDPFLKEVLLSFAAKYGKAAVAYPYGKMLDFAEEFKPLLAKFEASERGFVGEGATEERESEEESEEELDEDAEPESRPSAHKKEDDEEDEEAKGCDDAAHRSGAALVTKSGRRLGARGKNAGPTAGAHRSQLEQEQQHQEQVSPLKKKGKKPTKWEDTIKDPAVSKQRAKATEAELEAQTELQRRTYIKHLPNGAVAPVKEREWSGQQRGRVANWLRSYIGGSREVDQEDLQKVIPKLREKLISKNVAVEVAEHVCSSVEASLAGKKLGTFESLYNTVESAMVASLRRILQPRHEVNILRDVAAAKTRGKSYSIILCGVNGVGKSTSLAKIAYWLQQNGNSILIAAGDTFRHGAVEQLEVHGRCLGVPVFQMGYGADPSAVAAAAIAQASRQRTDVVMIDTAGRMQDHEPRMRALAKLIHDNQPDLILFVGEALVGNNGIDQLRKFNQCLVDYAPVGARSRGIDGIVLTKFDTIDDKVGAALSMVYELGQPIVFVGVGQTYQDLKVIEPDVVVGALMQ